jgi:hypothetical protein
MAKPIEMILCINKNGIPPTPIKFKWITEDQNKMTIKVDKIIQKEFIGSKLSRSHDYIYQCESLIDDRALEFELKYNIEGCRWMLWKI